MAKIVKIEQVPYRGWVYGIDVAEDESFVANGIVVHNCQEGVNQDAKFDIIKKAAPPREGLVPQSGDPEHPVRWIRPKDGKGKEPKAPVVSGTPKEPWQMTQTELENKYQKAGDIVDGRKVRAETPNMESISASVDTSTVLKGIYEVPMSEFEGGLTGRHYSVEGQEAIDGLAKAIARNKEINPLIVVIDSKGPYVLEGGTRAEALFKLNAKSFPAKVVIDEGSLYESVEQALSEGKPVPAEVLAEYPDLAQAATMVKVVKKATRLELSDTDLLKYLAAFKALFCRYHPLGKFDLVLFDRATGEVIEPEDDAELVEE